MLSIGIKLSVDNFALAFKRFFSFFFFFFFPFFCAPSPNVKAICQYGVE